MKTHTRWMIRADIYRVLEIERLSFEFPWTEEDFIQCFRNKKIVPTVAEDKDGSIIGFMFYELHEDHIHVINFAVHPSFKRKNVATTMVNKLIEKLSENRRNRIMMEVRETNLDALLFFKLHGFKAVSILRSYYDDSDEDAYLMVRRFSAIPVKPTQVMPQIKMRR